MCERGEWRKLFMDRTIIGAVYEGCLITFRSQHYPQVINSCTGVSRVNESTDCRFVYCMYVCMYVCILCMDRYMYV